MYISIHYCACFIIIQTMTNHIQRLGNLCTYWYYQTCNMVCSTVNYYPKLKNKLEIYRSCIHNSYISRDKSITEAITLRTQVGLLYRCSIFIEKMVSQISQLQILAVNIPTSMIRLKRNGTRFHIQQPFKERK